MASASPPTDSLKFDEGQRKTLGGLSFYAQLLAAALILLALVKIASSLLLLPTAPLVAVLSLVSGALIGVIGMVLLKASADINYIREVPSLAAAHLLNAVSSWQDFARFMAGLGIVLALLALVRLTS